jgi:glucose-6-phosphate 1-dehydrogenase
MIERLALFGATGDLTGRYLLPALATLGSRGLLPDRFQIVGAAQSELDDQRYRAFAAERLEQHAVDLPATARDDLLRRLRYRPVDLSDPASVAAVVGDGTGPVAAYLALPPGVYHTAIRSLAQVQLPVGSRIVLEKPFGADLDDAVALNQLITQVFGDSAEQTVFRVDHVLGLATVQNLLTLRTANRIFEPVWNDHHIEEIALYWEEDLALEGRAGYFDRAGILRDVMQNHLLQVLAVITMELPEPLAEPELSDRKVETLRSIRVLRPEEAATRTRRARYRAGQIPGPDRERKVMSYVDEEGVDPDRGTETFAELLLNLDHPRWSRTQFRLRAGKALRQQRMEAVIRFRPAHPGEQANQLRIGLDSPEDICLQLTGGIALPPQQQLAPLTLTAPPPDTELPAYGRVLLGILTGDSTLAVRGDEAEVSWQAMMPVLQAWADGKVPLEEYPAGSSGPPPL